MYRDMTRGSITRGLLLFALPMAAGARVALAYAPAGPVGVNGIWAAIPIGWFLADAVGYGYYFLRRRALLPGERETADSRNQKERCVTYELHPICWTVWYTVQQMGCVYMPKGIPQNQIKTKRPEPCAVQDSDRSDRLILILSNFWGSLPCGCGSFIILLLQGFSLHVFKGHFERNAFLPLPRRACAAAFAAPGSAWPYQWALPHGRPCLPPAPVDGPRQRRWP